MLDGALRQTAATLALVGLLLPWSAPAFAEKLFAADGGEGADSTLYILNPATGAVASTVGPIGFSITGLAYDPTTRVLYGSTGNGAASSKRSLVRIDTTTGAGTLIGPFNTNTPMADLTFGASGVLFGWSGFQGKRGLYTIDVATGAATFVGPNTGRGSFLDGNGLASDAAGNLFGGASDDAGSAALFSVNSTTAVSTFIANLTPFVGEPAASVSALAFDSTGTLFGVFLNINTDPFASFLVTIDTTTGATTNRGQSVDRLDAIAFLPDVHEQVPSLSTWGLTILMALLALAGMAHLRLRSRRSR